MAVTQTGVKITVDTSELDIKFTKSVEKLNATLSKSQKALGLFYNDQGLLSNRLGQCVEGLSQSQIKLGQYVDELGNVRTMQGGYTEGLTKTQIALGMYADELGNVYDITGKLVGQTDKAAKKLEKEAAEAAKKAAKEMEELKKAAQESANKLGSIGDKLDTATAQLGALGGNLRALGGALGSETFSGVGNVIDVLSNAQAAIANVKQLSGSITTLASNLSKAKTKAQGLKVVINSLGGPIGAALTALAVIQKTLNYFYPPKEIKELSDDFKQIEERAKKAKDTVENFYDTLKYGALSAYKTEADAGRERLEQVKELGDTYKQAKEDYQDYVAGIGALAAAGAIGGATGGTLTLPIIGTVSGATVGAVSGAATGTAMALSARHDMKAAENDYKNAMAEANKFIESYINEARQAEKTEVQKIKENIEGYELVKEVQNEHIEEARKAGESQEEIARLLADIETVERKISTLKEEEKKAAIQAAGMTPYLEAALQEQKKTAPSIAEFNEILSKWQALEEEGAATQEEINLAIKKKQEEIAGQLAAALGVDAPKIEGLELTGEFAAEAERLRESLKDGKIAVDAYAEQMDALRAQVKESFLDNSLQDLKNRYDSGQISADQYAQLIQGVKGANAENLLEKLDGFTDADEAARLIAQELQAGRITQQAANESEAKLAEIKERYAENLEASLDGTKDARLAKQKIEQALASNLITQNQYNEILNQLQAETAEQLRGAFQDKSLTESVEAARAWKDAVDAGVITQEAYNEELEKARASIPFYDSLSQEKELIDPLKEYNESIKNLIQARTSTENATIQDEELARLLQTLGETSATRDALGEYNDAVKRIAAAYTNGAIQAEQRDALYGKATDSLLESLNKEKAAIDEATEKRKKTLRDSLGVDSYLDSLKTPLEKYNETVAKIDEALKEGAINQAEAAAMEGKAQGEYWEQLDKLAETAQKGAEKIEKVELGQSSARGSESLYLAMVKNSTANFQNRIQQTTGQIANLQKQAIQETQTTNAYLATIAGAGSLPVFTG